MAHDKIKILHLDSSHEWRGGQQQVSYLVKGLDDQNFETAVACPDNSPLANFCVKKEIDHFPVEIKSEFDFLTAYKLAKYCLKNEFTIVHAHDAHSLSIATLTKNFCKKLIVIAARRVDFHVKKPIIGAFKYSNKSVNHVITVSKKIREILIEDGIPGEKITAVHSGIDIHKFDDVNGDGIRQEFNVPDNHFLIGTVAAISGHKDYPNLLKAAKLVSEKNPNITFLAVGNGPDEKKVKELAKELELTNFIFAGFRTDVGRFLKSFDAFVLASKTEGLGTSLLDAQAAGLPIVATKAGGIPEIVKDGENGLITPIKNPNVLAEKILKMKSDNEMRGRFSKNALEMVKAFDVSETVKKTIEIYKFVTNQP